MLFRHFADIELNFRLNQKVKISSLNKTTQQNPICEKF